MKTIFTFLGIILIALNVAQAQNVGSTAPDFTLKNLNDQNYTLSSNKGKVIFIFFIGNTCPNCIASAPTVKSTILSEFKSNSKFQALVIDTWDGSKSLVQNFQNSTSLDAVFLQKGKSVATSWSTTYDRIAVVDSEGKIVFKGTKAAGSDVLSAKEAINSALNSITTSTNDLNANDGNLLHQNFPNPFQNETKIKFSIKSASFVKLSVFDIHGKQVLLPIQKHYKAGQHEISLYRNGLKNGIYYYRLDANYFSATKSMILQ